VSDYGWDETALKTRVIFFANRWRLWVSDISYIQTDDIEELDKGECPKCKRVYFIIMINVIHAREP